MLIQPDTNIRLIRNCPLNNKYEHTIYFETVEEQIAYFKSLPGKPFTKQSYQRYASGVLTVQVLADEIYDCNYLMFQNAGFGLKWFYAFITKVEYVNNITTKVYYELDVMQTWHFDYKLNKCFVVREHHPSDNIGDNIVQENLYFGEYVYSDITHPEENGVSMEDMCVVIMYNPGVFSFDTENEEMNAYIHEHIYEANFYSGVYQGVNFLVMPVNERTGEVLGEIFKSVDFLTSGGVISSFLMPKLFLPIIKSGYNENNTKVYMEVTQNKKFGNYTPKNNKLFTFPYTCAYLSANRGQGKDFPYEFFAGDKATFAVEGNLCATPSVMAYPVGYKGVGYYLEGSVSIPSYPICTWGSDGLTEWINNNLFKSLGGIAAGALLAPVSPGLALQSVAGTAEHSFIGLAQSVGSQGAVHGNADGDILFGNAFGRHIMCMNKHITEQYARIIDDYFSRYGYATNRVKDPNRKARPHWNYVKTANCNANGALPTDDMRAICDIYDKGITFWRNGSAVCDYTQDNSPFREV